jgi:hypothetical protein
MPRRVAVEAQAVAWPDDPFDRLDLESLFAVGPGSQRSASGLIYEINLPVNWSLDTAEALWAAVGGEFEDDCWAASEWGEPVAAAERA